MNERIVYTAPDGSVKVITPMDWLPIETVIHLDVPWLVTTDIVFPDNDMIFAGSVIRIVDFYHEAHKQKLSAKKIGAIVNSSLEQIPHRQITIAELPQDRLFRSVWDDSNPEDFIGIDLTKAKQIAHGMRRVDREVKLIPLDREEGFVTTTATRKTEIISEKQSILDSNAAMQTDIDEALDEAALRTALN